MYIYKQLNNRGVSHMVLTKTLKNKMRKIYSLVLMATMLLMGTNVKADVTTWTQLSSAIEAANPGVETTITLGASITMNEGAVLLVNGNRNIELNLNGNNIVAPADVYYPIQVIGGKLTIKGNGTISASNAAVLKVEGSATDVANYSVLNVENGVQMTSTGEYGVVVRQAGSSKHSYGVVVYFDGYIKVEHTGGTAFWVLGNIQDTEGNIPQITIGPNAELIGATDGVGYYAGGYAETTIEGSVSGGAGIYAKAGEITIDGGHITATATDYSAPTANGNGFTGGMGCAIVSDSHNGYKGQMEITITGAAELNTNAGDGYAIKETKTNAEESKTKSLVIESGTINGDLNTTAELKENIVLNGTITGGTYSTDISEYLNPTEGALQQDTQGNYVVVEGCVAMLNSYGLATFSSPNYKVVLPSGVTAWIATGGMTGDALNLTKVAENEGDILPLNAGLILWGAANANLSLLKSTSTAPAVDVTGNLLKPATAWAAESFTEAYILHDNELWIYNGTEFKAGKAFLPLSAIPTLGGAPKRVSMIFNQTETPTAVENVEIQNVKAVKFVGEDGQLYIRRGEAVYTVQGQVVK